MKRHLTARTARRTGTPVAFAAALAMALASLPGRALAQTACGQLITNIASATMWSGAPQFAVYNVSYNATASVVVLCPPVISLRKSSNMNGDPLIECAAGCVVTFQICLDNQQFGPNDSVWNVTITDRLPSNMIFVTGTGLEYNTSNPSPGAIVATNASALAGTWNAGLPANGQGSPHYIRWVVPGIGPTKSACLIYRARIL